MRKALKYTAWTAAAAVLLLLFVLGSVLVIGNSAAGRLKIEQLTYRLTAGHVRLSGLSGSFPQHLTLSELRLVDGRGTWLTAQRIELDWTPLAYLAGRLQIDRLHAAIVDLERLPQSSGSGGEPSIPHIDIGQLSIDRVQLGAELAGAPATLTASGSARLRSVSDMLFDVTARRVDGDGAYEVHLHFDKQSLDATVNLHEPANGPLENILSLPGLGALQAKIDLHGPRAAERLELSLQAGALTGRAQGTLDLRALAGDLDVAFDAGAMAPRPDVSWDRAALKGRWQGDLKVPKADAHLEVSRLRLPGDVAAASLSADMHADLGEAELQAVLKETRIPGAQPTLLEDDPLRIDARLRLDDKERRVDLTVAHRLLSLRGQAVTAGKQSATAEIRLPDLAPWARYAGLDLHGSAVINAQLDGYPAATRIKLGANANLMPGSDVWVAALGERARLDFLGTMKDGILAVDSAELSGRAARVSASGTVGAKNIKARWQAQLNDLHVLSPVMAGTLHGSGSVDGPPSAFAAEANLTSSMSIRGSDSGVLTANAKLRGLPSTLSGTLAAQGLLDAAPLHVDVSLDRSAPGEIHAVIHQADWKSLHAAGDALIGTGGAAQTRGQLSLAVGQLSDLQRLTGIAVSGGLTASAALHADRQSPKVHLRAEIHDASLNGFDGEAQLAGDGWTDAFDFKAGARLTHVNGAPLALEATGSWNLTAQLLSIASAQLSYRAATAHLLAPAKARLGQSLSLEHVRIGANQAELDVHGEILPELKLHAALKRVGPALVNAVAPNLLAAGAIEAQADLRGSPTAPQGEVVLSAMGIEFADDAALGLPATNLHVTAGLRGLTADINAQLEAGSSHLSAVGTAPLAVDGAADMKISGKLDAALLNPFLEGRGEHAGGELTIDAAVAGNMAQPRIEGSLDLAKGSVNDYGRGLSLTDIAAQMVGSEGTLRIKSFTASAAPGSLSMSGSIGVLQPGIPVELRITASNARPVVSKLVTATLNSDLQIKGTARKRLDVSGTIHLNRTLVGVPNSLPPNVAILDVRRRGTKAAVIAGTPLVIGLDITVQAPNEILVQGRGLDAEMGGELHIGGTTDSPLVSGGFDLQRGNFTLASSRLNFTAGRVSFNGAGLKNKIDPTLDFTAQTALGTTTARLDITGPADAPVFTFSSTPPLPQDEIMAQLLFGQNIAQLSALQVAQIGYALATLSGVGGNGGFNPLVKLQKSLGLDRLNVGAGTPNATGQDTGASIEAGRYVTKHIYVEAKQNTTGSSQVQADIDLTKHLKLQTKLGNGTASVQGTTPDNDPGSSVGLVYQFEY